ncbi:MAG: enoyl-CoA hydratase [Acidimicrobiales bacterium]|nr:enoyl-CoA hydratase [Acidimicrobiales bacterium]
MSEDAPLRTTRRGSVAELVLTNGRRRNPLGSSTLRALAAELDSLAADEAVRAIVVAAEGPAFSAGHDLAEMRDRDDAFYTELFDLCVDVMSALHRVPQPVIAKVDGVATAAGCQLVASCDLAVASSRASFATPGVRIGLFCSTPMVPIVRSVGPKRTLELLLTGEPIDAATAAEWGLVNRVVEPDELDAAVDELVAQILRWSSATLAIGKEAFYRQLGRPEDDAYAMMAAVMAANASHVDAQEGIAAFCDKRDPEWRGRR